ncbi:hypothetical protein ACFX2B_013192 [Malus domestica]
MEEEIQTGFGNMTMATITTGGSYVCGINTTRLIVCRGSNGTDQWNVNLHQMVICWGGGGGQFAFNQTNRVSFEVIGYGSDFVYGLTTRNSSIVCWGSGWPNLSGLKSGEELELPKILPNYCFNSSCGECGIYAQSQRLCFGEDNPREKKKAKANLCR